MQDRVCKTCGELKPLESFTKHRLSKGGHLPHCKPCIASKSKAYKASKMPKEEKKETMATETQETVASTENATVVDDAISNGTQQNDVITAGIVNVSKTLKQKYQSAFNDEGFVITK